MGRKVLVFAPHPDDETLACGGAIAVKTACGENVRMVFLTDGRNSHLHALGIPADPSPGELAAIRKEEAVRAAHILGVGPESLSFLGIEDGTLERDTQTPAARIAELILDFGPDEVYYPDRLDRHRDHRAAFFTVEAALEMAGRCPRRFRYVIWHRGTEHVPGPDVRVEISGTAEVKKKALQEYRSQVGLISPAQTRPVLTDAFLARFRGRYEEFYA
ncbi:MAG: PIG-L family deacetylase [Dehalococcoidia bacterium]|nr:PIG-L family deacetylase [Dehalococcoidia bacterium]